MLDLKSELTTNLSLIFVKLTVKIFKPLTALCDAVFVEHSVRGFGAIYWF